MNRSINIVAFNVPYPPNYGGIIDVYYKLKALHAIGVRIILHCFEYERPPAPKLEQLCEKVYYYKRRTGFMANLSFLPYNVNSRRDPKLLKNLLANDYPILFEGLHTCYYIQHRALKKRFKIYRESNIEHDYYKHLAKACSDPVKKLFLRIESCRFRLYQKVLRHADLMLVVSTADVQYLHQTFPGKQIEYMPSFHANEQLNVQAGQSDYILYHGKLSVFENEQAALFLIREVFSQLKYKCIIAGMDPSPRLQEAAAPFQHITIEANPTGERMDELISKAQIQLLITFQDTGLKLKLLNSLFAGRHTVVNSLMLTGSGLDSLCVIADNPEDMIRACMELMEKPFTQELIAERQKILFPDYSNRKQVEHLYALIYEK